MSYVNEMAKFVGNVNNYSLPLTPTSISPMSSSPSTQSSCSYGSQHELMNLPSTSNWGQTNRMYPEQRERRPTKAPVARKKKQPPARGIYLYLYLFRSNFGYKIFFIRYPSKLKLSITI